MEENKQNTMDVRETPKSFTEYARKICKPIESALEIDSEDNYSWQDIDDYKIDRIEFLNNLKKIKQNLPLAKAFAKNFDTNDLLIYSYFYDSKDYLQKLCQAYVNFDEYIKRNGSSYWEDDSSYSQKEAHENETLAYLSLSYGEEIKEFLKYANKKLRPMDYINLSPAILDYLDELNSNEKQ